MHTVQVGRISGLHETYKLFVHDILGDLPKWRTLQAEDPGRFDLTLNCALRSVKILLHSICGRPLGTRGRPTKNTERDHMVYELYFADKEKYDDAGNAKYTFATLAEKFNRQYRPDERLTRRQAHLICQRQQDREIEDLAQIFSEVFSFIPADEMGPRPLEK